MSLLLIKLFGAGPIPKSTIKPPFDSLGGFLLLKRFAAIKILRYNPIMKRKIFTLLVLGLFAMPAYSIDMKLENFFADKNAESVQYEEETKEARAFYAQNNLEEAMNALVSIPAESRNAENWLLMGNIQQDRGNIKDAVFLFESALMTDSKFYKAYYNLGVIYFEQEKYALAVENFQKAKKYKNDLAIIYYNLGCTYLNMGEFKKARNEFLYAIQLKGTEPDYYYNLALAYKKMGNEKKANFYADFYEKVLANKN